MREISPLGVGFESHPRLFGINASVVLHSFVCYVLPTLSCQRALEFIAQCLHVISNLEISSQAMFNIGCSWN